MLDWSRHLDRNPSSQRDTDKLVALLAVRDVAGDRIDAEHVEIQ